MATLAVSSYNTQLQVADSGGSFATVAEVRTIGEIASNFNILDASNMDSPSAFKEWIGGMKDGEEFDLEYNAVPGAATQARLRTVHDARSANNFKAIFPT